VYLFCAVHQCVSVDVINIERVAMEKQQWVLFSVAEL
jgi:hypothetical protein